MMKRILCTLLCFTGLVLNIVMAPPLYAARAQANLAHPLLRGLQSWWRGVPGLTGSVWLIDLVAYNYGTLLNMGYSTTSGWSPSTRPGGYAQINFDGADDSIATTDPAGVTPSTPFTLCLWAIMTGTPSAVISSLMVTMSDSEFNGVDWRFGEFDSRPQLEINADGAVTSAKIQVTAGAALATGIWYHLCATYDGSQTTAGMQLYANGAVLPTAVVSDTGWGTFANNPWRIGSNTQTPPNDEFQGSMDSIMVWSRALPETDIAALYRLSAQGDHGLLTRAPGVLVSSPAVPSARGGLFPFLNQ
jgi:Concanavalin A-like lectin/glucanases superfamily